MATRFVEAQDARRNQKPAHGGFGQSSKPQRSNTPLTDHLTDRRTAAQNLKIGSRSKRASNSAPLQTTATVPPHPAYQSNPVTGRNGYNQANQYQPEQQQQQQQMVPTQQSSPREDIFNDTISTNWDQTRTSVDVGEIPFSQQVNPHLQDYHRQNQNDYDEDEDEEQCLEDETMHNNLGVSAPEGHTSPGLHRKRSQAHLKQEQQDMAGNQARPAISGRFHHPNEQPASHPNLQIRPGHEENASNPQSKNPKKRGRSNEPLRDVTNNAALQQQQRVDEEGYQEDDLRDKYEIGGPRGFQNGEQARELGGNQNQLEITNGIETPLQLESPSRERKLRDIGSSQQQGPPTPDYTDEELKSMPYAELKAESWEKVPGAEPYSLPQELSSPNVTLEQKIEFFAVEPDDMARAEFFAQMSTDEWHQAGDHIMSKMMELMKKLREAREKKRRIVESYENQYEAREKVVTSKSKNYDTKLKDMKASGEDVLRKV
jgi:hypothetical protein